MMMMMAPAPPGADPGRHLREGGRGRGMGRDEVVLALTLGLGLVTFDLLDGGLWAHEMCRFTLGVVERGCRGDRGGEVEEGWGWSMGRMVEVDVGLVPLVFMDVCNCVVRRQMPVCRLVAGEGERVVDKYIGLCGDLLAPLFDICRLSQRSSGLEHHEEMARKRILEELKGVEKVVLRWEPDVPEHFALTSTPDELRVIATQVSVYKAAVILLIHRLRYGFGTQNDKARRMSRTILDEIDTICCSSSTLDGQSSKTNGVFDYRLSFPFFVAAIEVQDAEERNQTLDLMRSVVCEEMYSSVGEGLRRALSFVWDARDRRCCTHWFELVPLSMPPYVLF